MNFSIRQSLQSSFHVFCQNIFKVVLLSAVSFLFLTLIQVASSFITVTGFKAFSVAQFSSVPPVSKGVLFLFILFRDALFALQALVLLFLTNAFLPAFKGRKVELKNYFPGFKKSCLFVIGVALLLVIPTIFSVWATFIPEALQLTLSSITAVLSIMLFRYFFFYIELLAGCSLFTSLKSSAMATKGNFFGVAGVIVATILINLFVLFSVNFFGIIMSVFILFTLPMTAFIFANVYSQLTQSSVEDIAQRKSLRIENEVMESKEKELI
ncbi:MAG: hypothetical protein LBS61_00875 [Endomicrobium sp.]|nr:hypothetical protein [Endomicrobium sp.]